MPEPEITEKYIRIRVRNPKLFQEGSFRTIDISKKEKIKAVIGKLKGETTTTVQSYLFDKESWTVERAQRWVREHGKKYEFADLKWIEQINAEGDTMSKITKNFRINLKEIDSENLTVTAMVSNEEKDRDDEIIMASAWKKGIANYKKHPVLLSSHNYRDLTNQIGEAVKVKITDEGLIMDLK